MERRTFLKSAGAAGVALAFGAPDFLSGGLGAAAPVRFGLDMYSLRSQNWTPFQQLEYCAKHGIKVVHFSEIRFIGTLEPENLKRVRAKADELNLDLEIGTRSICPTSAMFDASQGTAEEQLGKMVDAAKLVRSPIVRCVLGSAADRRGPAGIEAHIESMVAVLKRSRSRVMDSGVKVAIENHAGDMQARELKTLVEGAGPDFVGVCLDSGNPVWTIEDPHLTLETLAPYVLTSHMRDSALWNTPQGVSVAWTRMGEGNMGMDKYIRTYVEKCPGRAVSLETIVNGPRAITYQSPQFWEIYQKTPAWEFSRFLALAAKGTAWTPRPQVAGQTPASRELADVDASVEWTRTFLATL